MYSVFLQKMKKSLSVMFIFVFLLSFTLPVKAEAIDMNRKCSVTLQYKVGDASFSLYKVADLGKNGLFTLTGDFVSYQVTINGLDSDGWRTLGSTLSGYVSRDNLTPLMSGKTDADGKLSWANLPVGLYLVTGQRMTVNNTVYTPTPQMLALPTTGENNTWEYAPTVTLKFTELPDEYYTGEPQSMKVIKVWKDDNDKAKKRPTSIEAELLKDGEVYDTVTLNKDNSWTHTWEDLDGTSEWEVVEKDAPDSYNVATDQTTEDGAGECVITNTYLPDEPMIDEPNDSTSSTRSNRSEESSSNSNSSSERLPQTGQLWWPVSILAFAGIISLGAGLIQRKRA